MTNILDNSKKAINTVGKLIKLVKNDSDYTGQFLTGEIIRISFTNENIFRLQITAGTDFVANPVPNNSEHTTTITIPQTSRSNTFEQSKLLNTAENYRIQFGRYTLIFKKDPAIMAIYDEQKRRYVLKQRQPVSLTQTSSTEILFQDKNEFYFGGGTQNGRFSHKGTKIKIENTNIWTDGGVSSPNPFFWSNSGFGEVRNTFRPGIYDFGSNQPSQTGLTHRDPNFDSYYLLGDSPAEILNHYYKITGSPILLPKYALYEAHLNAYNRDFWVESTVNDKLAQEFPDGKYYREYRPGKVGDKKGTKESLNGEKTAQSATESAYQFSARAIIDRYKQHDLPLGWFLPNDGYAAGYGQTESFIGDLHNLEAFSSYANKHGIEVGLWTEEKLTPTNKDNPQKNERDLEQEVKNANVRALKTDVAWVGSGYSFGLNALHDATKSFASATKGKIRPNLLTIDGWAGTQRFASVWTGDQVGGQFEYIRFHIPTYIGTGLSGQPNIGSDMDGIYGGGDAEVNVRDFQWKTFTPIELNMDGWSPKAKNPFSYGRKATQINRAYLKLKSEMLPYNYSIAHEALGGKPMVRAMFLEFPTEKINYTNLVQYQYMWGPSLLIAPIYNNSKNKAGDSLRHNIYLPDVHQLWIDFFTGKKYLGGATYDNLVFAHWHTPVFVKAGAIIPMSKASNNPTEIDQGQRIINFYPAGKSEFTLIDDDGISTDYLDGIEARTLIESEKIGTNLRLTINKTTSNYPDFSKNQGTLLNILTDQRPGDISLKLNGVEIELPIADSKLVFEQLKLGAFYNDKFSPSEYFEIFNNNDEATFQKSLQIKLPELDVTASQLELEIKNFVYGTAQNNSLIIDSALRLPKRFSVAQTQITADSITLTWQQNDSSESYELLVNNNRHTNIKGDHFTLTDLSYDTVYTVKIRSKSQGKVSDWSEPLTVRTMVDPLTKAIRNIQATSNMQEQPERELHYLVDMNKTTEWATDPEQVATDPDGNRFLELTFKFPELFQLDRMEYLPNSSSPRGTLEELQFSFSTDGQNWSTFGEPISVPTTGVIPLNDVRAKMVKIRVTKSIENSGSGSEIYFFHK